MSPRLKSGLFYVVLALIGALTSFAADPPVETAGLTMMDGSPIPIFGKKHCEDTTNVVKVELSPAVLKDHEDFRYRFVRVTRDVKNTKYQSLCNQALGEDDKDKKTFVKASPHIPVNLFPTKNSCTESKGSSGQQVLCIYNGSGAGKLLAWAVVDYNTKVAVVESIKDRTALNGIISFTVVPSEGTGTSAKYETCYSDKKKKVEDAVDTCEEGNGLFNDKSKEPQIELKNLTNFTKYYFKVRILSDNSPPSKWSDIENETPVPATFPLNTYNGAGGELEFGSNCQQNSGSSLVLLGIALLGLLFLRMRSRRAKKTTSTLIALIAVMTLFNAEPSSAEIGQMNFGIIGSMYRPDLDSERLSSGDPIYPFYKSFFRRNPADEYGAINPLIGAEFDWHLWDGFGSLQLGFGVGYTFKSGSALELNEEDQPTDQEVANSKVSLHMYQLRPQLTYIFDPFAEYFPLIPYIRGSLVGHGYMFFQDKNAPADTIFGQPKVKPNGFRFGWQAAFGLMLMLDFLEPSAVSGARSGGLFEHVYLKAELAYSKIDTFGRPGFQFSAKDVMGSELPLLWTFGLVFQMP